MTEDYEGDAFNDDEGGDCKKDYEIGYGRPPKHTRWKKGQSGNRNGKKKGSRALKSDLDEALKETLTINVGGKKKKGTTQRLMVYTLAVKAATGDLRAARLLADLVLTVFGPGERSGTEAKLSKQDQDLLNRLLERLGPEGAQQGSGVDSAAHEVDRDPGGSHGD